MLKAKPPSSMNRLDVNPRWNCHTSYHVPVWYFGASRALTVSPDHMKSTDRARARSMKMTRWACAPVPPGAPAGCGDAFTPALVRHRVKQDVDAHGIPGGRELIETPRILALALPCVSHVGVVGHHDH